MCSRQNCPAKSNAGNVPVKCVLANLNLERPARAAVAGAIACAMAEVWAEMQTQVEETSRRLLLLEVAEKDCRNLSLWVSLWVRIPALHRPWAWGLRMRCSIPKRGILTASRQRRNRSSPFAPFTAPRTCKGLPRTLSRDSPRLYLAHHRRGSEVTVLDGDQSIR